MAKCGYCGTTILLGGVREGEQRYCGTKCRDNAYLQAASAYLPDAFVIESVRDVCRAVPEVWRAGAGRCPLVAHHVVSALMFSSHKTKQEVCCRSCGTAAKLKAIGSSGLLGWWHFPMGVVMTPVQILRNVSGLMTKSDASGPSEAMLQLVRKQLAEQLIAEAAEGAGAEEERQSGSAAEQNGRAVER